MDPFGFGCLSLFELAWLRWIVLGCFGCKELFNLLNVI